MAGLSEMNNRECTPFESPETNLTQRRKGKTKFNREGNKGHKDGFFKQKEAKVKGRVSFRGRTTSSWEASQAALALLP